MSGCGVRSLPGAGGVPSGSWARDGGCACMGLVGSESGSVRRGGNQFRGGRPCSAG